MTRLQSHVSGNDVRAYVKIVFYKLLFNANYRSVSIVFLIHLDVQLLTLARLHSVSKWKHITSSTAASTSLSSCIIHIFLPDFQRFLCVGHRASQTCSQVVRVSDLWSKQNSKQNLCSVGKQEFGLQPEPRFS